MFLLKRFYIIFFSLQYLSSSDLFLLAFQNDQVITENYKKSDSGSHSLQNERLFVGFVLGKFQEKAKHV